MRYSAASLLLVLLLGVSLGAKLATRPAAHEALPEFAPHVTAALRSAGFSTRTETSGRAPWTLVRARRGECRLAVGDYPNSGALSAVYDGLEKAPVTLRFVYRGVVTAEAPWLLPLAEDLIRRELRRIGFAPATAPILAILAGPGCDLGAINWDDVATLPV